MAEQDEVASKVLRRAHVSKVSFSLPVADVDVDCLRPRQC